MSHIENNKLIAKFMGYTDGSDYQYLTHPESEMDTDIDTLMYHKSWDWLMSVVEDINYRDDYQYSVYIMTMDCRIENQKGKTIAQCECKYDPNELIKSVYEAVVDFIKWYNEESIEWYEREPVFHYTLVHRGVDLQVTYSKEPHVGGIEITPLSSDVVSDEARAFVEKKINQIFKDK